MFNATNFGRTCEFTSAAKRQHVAVLVDRASVRKFSIRATIGRKLTVLVSLAIGLFLLPVTSHCQQIPQAPSSDTSSDVRPLVQTLHELQAEVQSLHTQLDQLSSDQQQARAEAATLRHELRLAISEKSPAYSSTLFRIIPPASDSAPLESDPISVDASDRSAAATESAQQANAERIGKLEENQDLIEGKLNDQYQTKIESASKYKVRLSGMVLFNTFSNRGAVDNLDFPGLAHEREADDSAGTFGASFRQSQIGLQAFGPEVAGAHTSADINFDFAGGFPNAPNGVSTGIVRLRTGTVRLDWKNTSIIAGQDHLFFAPLAPTSLATVAVPALAYSGNLWAWTPQVRVEHRVQLTEASKLTLEAGILDSLTGEFPGYEGYREATAGEKSGQPAYASRIAWSHALFGQELTAGLGGYYARQNWSFGRNIDSWTGTTDLTVPFGHHFELTGEFYRGRAIGGLGGGIDQTILASGDLEDPTTTLEGLNSMGGWAQLKFKPVPKFEVNGAFGHDNPFGSQIARFTAVPVYYDSLFSKNQTWFTNFIYQPRSDVLFSIEFRRLRTFGSEGEPPNLAHQLNFALGYLF
jgi:hypothetical protein